MKNKQGFEAVQVELTCEQCEKLDPLQALCDANYDNAPGMLLAQVNARGVTRCKSVLSLTN